MLLKNVIRACAVIVVLAGLGFGAWLATLPPARAATAPAAIPAAETEGMLAALRRPARQRPVVAVIGLNDATETTDYLMPLGILRRADIADVVALATAPGPVKLYPALSVEPDATVAAFDARRPEGADYVIVPAMSRVDPAALRWIRSQAHKGATIVGVCAGAKVVAAAGLLAGKRATTHWYYLKDLLEISPTTTYVPNRRFVADGAVVTTTGITASMPMMLTVIEAIAGADRAASVARGLGVGHWDARHASSAFGLTRPFALTVLGNRIRVWAHEELALELTPGMDEVSLALQADAWSRTYRSRAVTFARTAAAVGSRNGIRILPDRLAAGGLPEQIMPTGADGTPAAVLDGALAHVEQRYGGPTADVVAVQLEYPWPGRRKDSSR
jgi:putative intracellular protease/amidase